MQGQLILENGMSFTGKIFGHQHEVGGELVFNTSMTGYQEILTDPSYCGQMIVLTYPMIGNYGINFDDMESSKIHASALIIKDDAKLPSNFRCEITLDTFLRQNGVVGFKGVDTRRLTQVIREQGAMRALIVSDAMSEDEIAVRFAAIQGGHEVAQVSTPNRYQIQGEGLRLGVLDFGVKNNILRSFSALGCELTVFPWNTSAAEVLAANLDGLFLSNGPGDPAVLTSVIEELRQLVGKLPLVGICLGHQLLALALGGTTRKLKYGHRGANHPVKDLLRNRVYITSQNHGYVVDKMPEGLFASHYNVNDRSNEGMYSRDLNLLSVQYHPEAWPGPEDSSYLFEDFLRVVRGEALTVNSAAQ